MDSVRSFASNNRGSIINVVYIAAVLLVLYYVYMFLMAGSELHIDLVPQQVNAQVLQKFEFDQDGTNKKPFARITTGGEYTISFWMYIKDWTIRSGMTKSVLSIRDTSVKSNSLFVATIYPNEAKLMLRPYVDTSMSSGSSATQTIDYTDDANYKQLLSGQGTPAVDTSLEMPQCDLVDIDLQRWINITVVMNGRIMDVYYDGKLARSCVLPNLPIGSDQGKQSLLVGQYGGFNGFVSTVQFDAQALTPDRIYATYQAGPATSNGFMSYMAEKLGINIKWSKDITTSF